MKWSWTSQNIKKLKLTWKHIVRVPDNLSRIDYLISELDKANFSRILDWEDSPIKRIWNQSVHLVQQIKLQKPQREPFKEMIFKLASSLKARRLGWFRIQEEPLVWKCVLASSTSKALKRGLMGQTFNAPWFLKWTMAHWFMVSNNATFWFSNHSLLPDLKEKTKH